MQLKEEKTPACIALNLNTGLEKLKIYVFLPYTL